MKKFEHNFFLILVTINLFAVVFYGGRYITSGSFEAHAEEQIILVKSEPTIQAAMTVSVEADATEAVAIIGDATKGAKVAKKCKVCHSFKANGRNKVGPVLWDIYEAAIAEKPSFKYSKAFKAKKGQISWSEDNLDAFLKKPKKFIKGTKMTFAGIRKEADRANLIAWMKEQK